MTGLELTRDTALAIPSADKFRLEMQAINKFQELVHQTMIPDQDYGIIPGTQKPTLLKPGAEKITKLLGLADTYEIVVKMEDWEKPFFRYLIRADLIHINTGVVISQGLGECNSMEAKYRWRESKRKCPQCGAEAIIKGKKEYGGGWLCFKKQGGCGWKFADGDKTIEEQVIGRVENEDIYSQVNTILKMAKKRALVDAALSAGRLSNIFTQDMEDMPQSDKETGETTATTATTATVKAPQEKSQPDQPCPGNESDIEIGFLQNSIKTLRWAEPLVRQHLQAKYQVDLKGSLETVLKRLSPEQLKDFQSEVASREALK